MNKYLKWVLITLSSIICFFGLIFLINSKDVALNAEVSLLLNSEMAMDSDQEKQCAGFLGFAGDAEKEFESEGQALFQQMKMAQTNHSKIVSQISKIKVNRVELKSECDGFCNIDENERVRLKTELDKSKIIEDRFAKLIQYEKPICTLPIMLLRLPILAFYQSAHNQIVRDNLFLLEGHTDKVVADLFNLNAFVRTLLKGKLTLIQGLLYTKLIVEIQKAVLSIVKIDSKVSANVTDIYPKIFESLNYDQIAARIYLGELQASHWLIEPGFNGSQLDFPYFERELENGEIVENWASITMNSILDKLFLRNHLINQNADILKNTILSCAKSEDVICGQEYKLGFFDYLYNPIGNYFIKTLSIQYPHGFAKLNKLIHKLSKSPTADEKI